MKTLLMTIALGTALTMSAQAQTNQTRYNPETDKAAIKSTGDQVETQAQRQTELMTKDLGLNAEQSQELMQANTVLYKEYQGMAKSTDKAEMDGMKNKAWDRYDASLKGVLNQSQFEKYTSMKGTYEQNFAPKKATGVKTM